MNNRFACAIAGAKGGVGKTTTSINLGASLAAAGYSTVTVELDLAMANLVDFLDVDIDVTEATTLHDVLAGECGVEAATYGTDSGLSVVPSGTDLQGYAETDLRRLPDVVETLRWHYDIVLLDTPAGLSEETVRPMQVADEVILVSTPRVASVRNVQNTKQLAERVDCDVRGLVLTKSGTGASPGADRVAEFLEVELLGHVPEDEAVPHSQDRGRPVVSNAPNSGASIAYRKIAMELVGAEREDLEHKGAPPSDGTAASGEESLQSDQAGSGGKRARPLEPTDGGTVVSPSTSSDAGVSDSRDPETTQGDRGDARESDEQPSHQEGAETGEATEAPAAVETDTTAAESATDDEVDTPESATGGGQDPPESDPDSDERAPSAGGDESGEQEDTTASEEPTPSAEEGDDEADAGTGESTRSSSETPAVESATVAETSDESTAETGEGATPDADEEGATDAENEVAPDADEADEASASGVTAPEERDEDSGTDGDSDRASASAGEAASRSESDGEATPAAGPAEDDPDAASDARDGDESVARRVLSLFSF
ncbi:P-loop NTPase [Halomicroarcula sp. GCM10025817]|uniref:P-loop NTPase n=1 Tax=Halomicroarcula sp. GCM10025817 TaxID=3252672 RepID=UPI00361D1923